MSAGDMVKIRKACSYRQLETPYTRISKYRAKAFIRAVPQRKIVRYDMGETKRVNFPYSVTLLSKDDLQIRHNALEAARMTSNRLLEKVIGKTGYRMQLRVFPHHILRENPLASGAGADRMSTGMQLSFGKPISSAAQVRRGQLILEVKTEKQHLDTVKKAMDRAKNKLPCSCWIEIVENKSPTPVTATAPEKKAASTAA